MKSVLRYKYLLCQQNVILQDGWSHPNSILISINKRQRIPKWQSQMDNPEKLATRVHKMKKNKIKTHNTCWTLLYTNNIQLITFNEVDTRNY